MGDDAALEPLKRLLIERTEGNPFFIEETVRDLTETGALVGERGAYRLARPVEDVQVPHTIRAVLAARIDRLPVAEKRLLQSAAVIGKDVPFALLHTIAEQPDEALHHHLANLQSAGLLHETTLFPDPEYSFKHALTHEVAYGSLVHEGRRLLHAKLMHAIETAHTDRLTEHIERLGYHSVRGEVWDKAAAYLGRAGAKAMARSAFRQAVEYLEQALDVLAHVPERRDTIEHDIDLRLALQRALHPLGETERIDHHLRRADTLARELGDERRLARVAADMASYLWLVGKPVPAAESARRALAIAAAQRDPSLTVAASYYLGQAYHALGDCRPAIDILRGNVTSLERDLTRGRFGVLFFAASCAWLAWCLAELGEFEDAADCAAKGLRIAETFDQQYSLIAPYFGAGILHLIRGDFPRSTTFLERCFDLSRTSEFLHYLPLIGSVLGFAYAQCGRVGEAVALVAQTVRQTITFPAGTNAFLSEVYLLAGRVEEARRLAVRALELSREAPHRGLEAYVVRLLGEISSDPSAPHFEEAEAHYHQAIALARELGMRPLVAHGHLGLGKVYGRTDKRREALAHPTSAATSYREMGMQSWLEKAEAEGSQRGAGA